MTHEFKVTKVSEMIVLRDALSAYLETYAPDEEAEKILSKRLDDCLKKMDDKTLTEKLSKQKIVVIARNKEIGNMSLLTLSTLLEKNDYSTFCLKATRDGGVEVMLTI